LQNCHYSIHTEEEDIVYEWRLNSNEEVSQDENIDITNGKKTLGENGFGKPIG
jgi:hypothetical protein